MSSSEPRAIAVVARDRRRVAVTRGYGYPAIFQRYFSGISAEGGKIMSDRVVVSVGGLTMLRYSLQLLGYDWYRVVVSVGGLTMVRFVTARGYADATQQVQVEFFNRARIVDVRRA